MRGMSPFRARVWKETLYLLLDLPVGVVGFTLVVTGLSLAFGLLITLLGIPVLAATLLLARVRVVRSALGLARCLSASFLRRGRYRGRRRCSRVSSLLFGTVPRGGRRRTSLSCCRRASSRSRSRSRGGPPRSGCSHFRRGRGRSRHGGPKITDTY